MKCIIISGLLYKLSDNIIPFLDKETDVYVHTWDMQENSRWVVKLNRYKKYCNQIKVIVEKPFFDKKLFSYFYSTWKVVNMVQDIDKYTRIVKFKPNVEGEIQYKGDIEYYFLKGKLQSRPLLKDVTLEECVFGTIHYKTLDERIFTGLPLGFKKAFIISEEHLIAQMKELDAYLISKFGIDNYEGSIFWTKWFENRKVHPILDIDLKTPNSIAWQQ